MAKTLLLDLDARPEADRTAPPCAYAYRKPGGAHGVDSLREWATFALVCRRCRHASCIAACPLEALERGPDGILVRHNLRCVSCKSCVVACPFGTIYPELVPFYSGVCDYCLESRNGGPPPCAANGDPGIEWREVDPEEPDVFPVTDHLAVRTRRWDRKDGVS